MDPAGSRLFVAVLAPPAVQAAVASAQAALRPLVGSAMRFGNPSDAHVTLLFLGATPAAPVDALLAALAPVAGAHAPFVLRTGGFGAFPSVGRARVAWLALDGDTDALAVVQRAVVAALRPLGCEPEPGPFTAHLTVGRVRDRATRAEHRAVTDALRSAVRPPPAVWPVGELCLMVSRPGAGGPRYQAVGRWALGTG